PIEEHATGRHCQYVDRRAFPDVRGPQGDRTILTRLLILSHSAFSAASTKTPHERRRAQVRAPEPVWVSMPPRWGSLPGSPARGRAHVSGSSPASLVRGLPVLDPGNSMMRLVRSPCQHTFFEGKKAQETFTRKSTSRTLKEFDQQYPLN